MHACMHAYGSKHSDHNFANDSGEPFQCSSKLSAIYIYIYYIYVYIYIYIYIYTVKTNLKGLV